MITDKEVCCKSMKAEIDEFNSKDVYKGENFKKNFLVSSIWYEEETRGYYLLGYKEVDNFTGIPIDYCPFCGAKLPERLDPDDYIVKEYGEDYIGYTDRPEYKPLPSDVRKEFKSDLWWKRRGL